TARSEQITKGGGWNATVAAPIEKGESFLVVCGLSHHHQPLFSLSLSPKFSQSRLSVSSLKLFLPPFISLTCSWRTRLAGLLNGGPVTIVKVAMRDGEEDAVDCA